MHERDREVGGQGFIWVHERDLGFWAVRVLSGCMIDRDRGGWGFKGPVTEVTISAVGHNSPSILKVARIITPVS